MVGFNTGCRLKYIVLINLSFIFVCMCMYHRFSLYSILHADAHIDTPTHTCIYPRMHDLHICIHIDIETRIVNVHLHKTLTLVY